MMQSGHMNVYEQLSLSAAAEVVVAAAAAACVLLLTTTLLLLLSTSLNFFNKLFATFCCFCFFRKVFVQIEMCPESPAAG